MDDTDELLEILQEKANRLNIELDNEKFSRRFYSFIYGELVLIGRIQNNQTKDFMNQLIDSDRVEFVCRHLVPHSYFEKRIVLSLKSKNIKKAIGYVKLREMLAKMALKRKINNRGFV
jgi:hypothetical protein